METVPTGPHRPRAELRALTGLRAIAALAVVISHTGVPASAPEPIRLMAAWGYVGVPLFFMLSGFVLAYNYPDLSLRNGRVTIRFYVARIARVMPLYWLMLLYCWAALQVTSQPQHPKTFLLDLFGLQTWGGDLPAAQWHYNGPGWSIGVELFFYALFPLFAPLVAVVARRLGRSGLVVLVLAAAGISIALWLWFYATGRADLHAADPDSAHRWLYRNPLPHLVEFIVGLAAAHLLRETDRLRLGWHHLLQSVVVAYAIGLAALHSPSSTLMSSGSFSALWVIPFVVLLLSLGSGQGWFARFLSTNVLVRIGTASYALYITHRWFLSQLIGEKQISSGHGWTPYLGLLIVLLAVLGIAEGAHQYVELPCRKAILRWSRRIGRPQPRSVGSFDQPTVTTTEEAESERVTVSNR